MPKKGETVKGKAGFALKSISTKRGKRKVWMRVRREETPPKPSPLRMPPSVANQTFKLPPVPAGSELAQPRGMAVSPADGRGWWDHRQERERVEYLRQDLEQSIASRKSEGETLVAFTDSHVAVLGQEEGFGYNPREEECLGVLIAPRGPYSSHGDTDDYAQQIREDMDAVWNGEMEGEGYPGGDTSAIKDYLADTWGTTVMLPVSVTDHSSLRVFVGEPDKYSMDWDTTQIGYIIDSTITREGLGVPPEKVDSVLRMEVSDYDDYVNGKYSNYVDVYTHKEGWLGERVDRQFGVHSQMVDETAQEMLADASAPGEPILYGNVPFSITSE